MKKPLIFFLFIVLSSLSVKGQQKASVEISGGVGYSQIEQAAAYFYDASSLQLPSEYEPIFTYTLPEALNLSVDYTPPQEMQFGVSVCYQYVDIVRSEYSYLFSNYRGERLSRLNTSLRFSFNLSKHKKDTTHEHVFEAFIGFKIGISYWTDNPRNSFQLLPQYVNYMISPFYAPSFQVFLTFREYPFLKVKGFLKNFGLQEEIGYGSPYIVEGGLTYRL